MDLAIAGIERIPGPTWVPYAIATIICTSLSVGLRLLDGATISPVNTAFAAFTVLPIAVIHLTGWSARRALSDFRSALGELEPEYADLERRLTTLPLAASIVAALMGGAVVAADQLSADGGSGITAETSVTTNVVTVVLQVILNAGFIAFVFYAVHLVWTITVIHRDSTAIVLWDVRPHNAFARVTMIAALTLVVPYALVEVVANLRREASPVEADALRRGGRARDRDVRAPAGGDAAPTRAAQGGCDHRGEREPGHRLAAAPRRHSVEGPG